jgi:septum site-determining protein MinC
LKQDLISFKGVKEGIFLSVYGNDISEIKKQIYEKLKRDYDFYKDTKLIGIKGEELAEDQIIELKLILRYKYDLDIADEELPKSIVRDELENDDGKMFKGIECGMTKFVNGTLRSGQVVNYPGNIVIMGDVNPGALIKASGNIVVLGTLRGVAHAGIDGNLDSVVAAYNLQPTQLRIGQVIGRPPDSGMKKSKVPEVAKVKDTEVIIEPYLPNK